MKREFDFNDIGKRMPYKVPEGFFDTLEDNAVTVRDRDTMQQIRMPISELKAYLDEKLFF